MLSGYISTGYMLLQMAVAADESERAENFVVAKKQTLEFYVKRILPRVKAHKAMILNGSSSLDCKEFELEA